jgi:hypothetical protein
MLLCGGWGRESESRAPSQRSLGPPPEPVAAITERRGGNPTRARRAPESSRRSGRGQSWEEASTGSRRLRRSPSSRAVPRWARPARVVARRTRPRALHDGRGVGQTPLYLRGARPQRRGCPYGWPHVLWRVCRRGEASDRIADEAPSRDRAAHQHRPSAVTGRAGHVPRHLSRRVHMYAATLLHDPRRNGRGRGSAPPSGRARLEGTAGGHRARRRDRRDAGRCDLAGRRPRDRRPHEHLLVLAQGSSEMASPARCLSSNCQRSLSSPRDRVREEFRACRSGTRLFSGAREIAETAGEERLERLVTACRG